MPTIAATTRAERLDHTLCVVARSGTLNRLHRALVAAAGVDVDRAAYLVLRMLHLDGPSRISDLATVMGVEPSTASRHVHMLERRGWVTKHPGADDRRVAVAEVTSQGRQLVEQIEAGRRRIFDRTLAEWPDEDLDGFVRLFERFADDLATALDGP